MVLLSQMPMFDHDERMSQPPLGRGPLGQPPSVLAEAIRQGGRCQAGRDVVFAHGEKMPRRIADFVQRVRSNSGNGPIRETMEGPQPAAGVTADWNSPQPSEARQRRSPYLVILLPVPGDEKVEINEGSVTFRQSTSEDVSSESWRAPGIVEQLAGRRERPEEFEQQRLFLGIYPMTSAEFGYGPDFRQIVRFDLLGFDVFGQGRVLRTSRLRPPAFYKN
ncbi:hypothetical protein ATY78_19795 [Rhizobium sp. R635]|nr:hypothetical protein ATY78_19795 [Rhizobium sp. R635]